MANARKLGGIRRRRERAVACLYDFEGLDSLEKIRRLVELAALDTIRLGNSVARSRTLAYLAMVAVKVREVEGLDERLESLESAIAPRLLSPRP